MSTLIVLYGTYTVLGYLIAQLTIALVFDD